jgi:hypothetical protein
MDISNDKYSENTIQGLNERIKALEERVKNIESLLGLRPQVFVHIDTPPRPIFKLTHDD